MDLALAPPARAAARPFGDRLREWRQRRRMSQLDLAGEAGISTRHLSFAETGRSVPSHEMVLRLAERLEIPLRERNALLGAAGYAPMYRERPLDDPALSAAREAVQLILQSHEPYPALAVDRHWNLLAHNAMVPPLLARADPSLLQGTVNVLRPGLHPQGLAPHIINLGAVAPPPVRAAAAADPCDRRWRAAGAAGGAARLSLRRGRQRHAAGRRSAGHRHAVPAAHRMPACWASSAQRRSSARRWT